MPVTFLVEVCEFEAIDEHLKLHLKQTEGGSPLFISTSCPRPSSHANPWMQWNSRPLVVRDPQFPTAGTSSSSLLQSIPPEAGTSHSNMLTVGGEI